jgi:hypothetical protein
MSSSTRGFVPGLTYDIPRTEVNSVRYEPATVLVQPGKILIRVLGVLNEQDQQGDHES